MRSCDLHEVKYGDRVQILSAISDCRNTQRGTWSSLTFDQKVSHPALITCAVLAMGVLLVYLKFILVPLVMSIFFSYFLQPLVEMLADRPLTCVGRECCVDWCGSMSGGQQSRHKPEPEPFLEAARRLGVEPARCVVWEDSDLGIEAARRAGMTWIDVRSFHTPRRMSQAAVA